MSRVANFCPNCGARLTQQERYGRMRPVCPECEYIVFFEPKVAVVVFLLRNNDAELLLVKRGMNPGKGRWALPAGFVDAGEDPKIAAIREVKEETGLDVQIERLLDVFHANDEGLADIVIAYAGRVLGGTLKADDDAEAAAWFTRENIPPIVFTTTDTLIKRWQGGSL
ncbi:MAG: NUDIX hydrolase [Phototrophicales bacterium]|nr:MAG: NUDIX hydrolase [Phototrophicales bacterium]